MIDRFEIMVTYKVFCVWYLSLLLLPDHRITVLQVNKLIDACIEAHNNDELEELPPEPEAPTPAEDHNLSAELTIPDDTATGDHTLKDGSGESDRKLVQTATILLS